MEEENELFCDECETSFVIHGTNSNEENLEVICCPFCATAMEPRYFESDEL